MVNKSELTRTGYKKLPSIRDTMIKEVYEEDYPNLNLGVIKGIILAYESKISKHTMNQDGNIPVGNPIFAYLKYKFQDERTFPARSKENGAIADIEEKYYPAHFKSVFEGTSILDKASKVRHLFEDVDTIPTVTTNIMKLKFNIIESETFEETFDKVLNIIDETWRTKRNKICVYLKDEKRIKSFKEFVSKELKNYDNKEVHQIKERKIRTFLEKYPKDITFDLIRNKKEKKGEC